MNRPPRDVGDGAPTGETLTRRDVLLAATVGFAAGDQLSEFADNWSSGVTSELRGRSGSDSHDGDMSANHGDQRYAAPGEVRTELENAAGTPGNTRLNLFPETVYAPAETWPIEPGVTLEYNGAVVEPSADIDLHDTHPGGCVVDPMVDLRGLERYTSSVFRFDSGENGFYGHNPPWHVRGGFTRGQIGEGTLFEFAQGGENAIYFVHVAHSVHGIGTVVDMHRSDQFGINSCRIYGVWYGFETGIHTRTVESVGSNMDNLSANIFDVNAQPLDGSSILWDLEVGRFNILRGQLWDHGSYEDVMWRIHAEEADSRYGNVMYWHPVQGSPSYLLDNNRVEQAFDDQLGNEFNRVVIPWLQGNSVQEFVG